MRRPLRLALAAAVLAAAAGAWALLAQGPERLLASAFGPPEVSPVEAYEPDPGGATFDHSGFDAVLAEFVDEAGWVDYEGLVRKPQALQRYVEALGQAPFDALGRDEKLALLINAYNAFTLKLIVEHYPVDSIRDIPAKQRWKDRRWQVGEHTWSLDDIEHRQIRPNFRDPRVHFVLVCAAIGCPVLRREAYVAGRLDRQLDAQARATHEGERWFRFDPPDNAGLTKLYLWYEGDFEAVAPSVLDYAARYAEPLRQALAAGREVSVDWLEYDWRLNSQANRPAERR